MNYCLTSNSNLSYNVCEEDVKGFSIPRKLGMTIYYKKSIRKWVLATLSKTFEVGQNKDWLYNKDSLKELIDNIGSLNEEKKQ